MRTSFALVTTLTLLTVAPTGCSSSSSAPTVQEELRGEYRATTSGPVKTITFADSSHYSMVTTSCGAGVSSCTATGTYSLSGAYDSVTFTDAATGAATTLPFHATQTGAATNADSLSSHLLGVSLIGSPGSGGGSLTSGGGTSLIVALLVELIEAFMAGGQGFSAAGADGGAVDAGGATGGGGVDAGADVGVADVGVDAGQDAAGDSGSEATGNMIPLTLLAGQTATSLPHLMAQVSVGGSPPFTAELDTGSIGLRVLDGVVPDSAWTVTSQTNTLIYGGSVTTSGFIATAVVTVGGISTNMPISVAKITGVGCTSTVPNCSASGKTAATYRFGGGAVAILGVGLRSGVLASPLAAMGNNQQYILRAPPPGETSGSAEIDPSPFEVANFATLTQLPTFNATPASGVPSWDDTAVPFCINSLCATGIFDTGANAGINASQPSDFANLGVPDNSTSVPSGTAVTISIDQGPSWSFTVGTPPVAGTDLIPLGVRSGNRSDNLGQAPFRQFDAFYDFGQGTIGFAPKQ